MVAVVIGALMFAAVAMVLFGVIQAKAQQTALWVQSVHGRFAHGARPKPGFFEAMHEDMVRFAKEIGRPAWGDVAYRVSFALPLAAGLLAVLLRWFWALPLCLLAFFLPYVMLHRSYRRARLLLRRQLRQARLLMALLAQAGAPVERGIVAAEAVTGYPLKPYLRDVCIAIGQVPGDAQTMGQVHDSGLRVQTVTEAFLQMAERLRLPEATQFAQLLAQAGRYNTPLTDMLFTSLEIEERLRDAEAEAQYNRAISRISYLSTMGLGIPVFAYMFLAVFTYMLQLLSGTFNVGLQ